MMQRMLLSDFYSDLLMSTPNLTVHEAVTRAKRAGFKQAPETMQRSFYYVRSKLREEERPIPADTVTVVTEAAEAIRDTDAARKERQFNEMLRVANAAASCGGVANLAAIVSLIHAVGVDRVSELTTYLQAMEHATCDFPEGTSSLSSAERTEAG